MGELGMRRMGERPLDTSDATAGAADILTGKTAYVNGVKLTGTLVKGKTIYTGTTSDEDTLRSKCDSYQNFRAFVSESASGYSAASLEYKVVALIKNNGSLDMRKISTINSSGFAYFDTYTGTLAKAELSGRAEWTWVGWN